MDYKFDIRNTTEKDYPLLCEWWKWWKWSPIPQEILPNNGNDGIILEHEGERVIAGFIYATSAPVLFHFEWIISSPKIKDRGVRNAAKCVLINKAGELIKQAGGKYIYSSLKSDGLINSFKECGWQAGSKNSLEMIKVL